MARRWSCVWVLFFVIIHLYSTGAIGSPVARRDDATTAVSVTSTEITTSPGNEASTETIVSPTSTPTPAAETTTPIVVATATATAFPTAVNGNKPASNSSLDDSNVVPEGQLPLRPRLSPGWGVAGAILLISGAIYTLIGIKMALLHTFFSAAFLTGLSVTVLIIYVMAPPVPTAIEGAYVVAAVVAGLIIGGVATIFREITEGLGCLLGGFCFAMWLLTLKTGGLITGIPAKAIFIAILSLAAYGLYFSRRARPYAQIVLMSFAGATVTVIGIDSFTRAGLKEFWAYIWELNTGLFPDGTSTYPLTKGIRVETALIVVFAILGIISQLKLWQVIKAHRAKKTEAQAKEQEIREEEEAALGLQIEEQTAREREQWELIYGNHATQGSIVSGDSGLDGIVNEKEAQFGRSAAPQVSSDEDNIEMAELHTHDDATSPEAVGQQPFSRLMATSQEDEMGVVIKVGKDDAVAGGIYPSSEHNGEVEIVNNDSTSQSGLILSSPVLQPRSKSPGPAITPLPFTVPHEFDADDSRSSVGAYADGDDSADELGRRRSILSLASRLSASSVNLLRGISQQSRHPLSTKRMSKGLEAHRRTGSTENLVKSNRYSNAFSAAATIDGLSQDGEDYDYITRCESPLEPTPAAILDADENVSETNLIVNDAAESDTKPKSLEQGWRLDARPSSVTETVGTDIPKPSIVNSSSGDISKESTLNQGTHESDSAQENGHPADTTPTEATSESSKAPKSLAPSIASTSVSLTKDRLPSALPRVALSYRTNEWAKHLSMAEEPPLEQLHLEEVIHRKGEGNVEAEVAAPVHVEELQQTAETGVAPAANVYFSPITTSPSQIPAATYRPLSRMPSYSQKAQGESLDAGAWANPARATTSNVVQASHGFRNKAPRRSWEVYTQPIQEDDNELNGSGDSTPNSSQAPPSPSHGVVPYPSPQTLMGKREMILRQRTLPQQHGILPGQEHSHFTRSASQMSNYAVAPLMTQDADDIPLSQRRQLMRQSTSMHSIAHHGGQTPPNGAINSVPRSTSNPLQMQPITTERISFDSHQPARQPMIPSQAERDARLSHFRQSVAYGLRAMPPAAGAPGRDVPLVYSASSPFLLQTADVDRSIEQQRTLLLTQREQEVQKREFERLEKERNERTFEEMMRRGDMIDAHRQALRRMQGGVKHV